MNYILEVFTVILALATVILAIATYKLANVSKKSFDLDSRPYFAFSGFLFTFSSSGIIENLTDLPIRDIQIGLQIKNPGRVLISYEVKSIQISISDKSVSSQGKTIRSSVIYPNDTTIFWCEPIRNVDISVKPISGIVDYQINYSSVDQPRPYITHRKIHFTLFLNDQNYEYKWLYLEETDSAEINNLSINLVKSAKNNE